MGLGSFYRIQCACFLGMLCAFLNSNSFAGCDKFVKRASADLPARFAMGYAINHRYQMEEKGPDGTDRFTFFSAVPLPHSPEEVLEDYSLKGFEEAIPRRFVVGDGSSNYALIGVDLTPGSPLERAIKRIHNSILIALSQVEDHEKIIKLVSQNVANHLGPLTEPLPWDEALPKIEETKIKFNKLDFNHPIIDAGFSLPVVPLEDYIDEGRAFCLAQALTAWLVLRSFNIPSRMHFGANAAQVGTHTGHSSVELEDGRIVDPGGWMVISPPAAGEGLKLVGVKDSQWTFLPGFLTYPGALYTWRVRFQRYPVLVLEKNP